MGCAPPTQHLNVVGDETPTSARFTTRLLGLSRECFLRAPYPQKFHCGWHCSDVLWPPIEEGCPSFSGSGEWTPRRRKRVEVPELSYITASCGATPASRVGCGADRLFRVTGSDNSVPPFFPDVGRSFIYFRAVVAAPAARSRRRSSEGRSRGGGSLVIPYFSTTFTVSRTRCRLASVGTVSDCYPVLVDFLFRHSYLSLGDPPTACDFDLVMTDPWSSRFGFAPRSESARIQPSRATRLPYSVLSSAFVIACVGLSCASVP